MWQRRRALILLALSLAFILIGAYRGEVKIVFTKAAWICLECIGIG
ncbi:MAG: thioredoxin [Synergistaceae bacterium]|nr:thioredoxin [Synergistaceae bacterium]